jgi:hypothetical protein
MQLSISNRSRSRAAVTLLPGAIILATITTAASAQSSSKTAASVVLAPGAADLTTSHLGDTTISYRTIADRLPDGSPTATVRAVAREETRHVTDHGRRAILLIKTARGASFAYADTSLMIASTLAPIREVSILNARRTTYAYHGAKVRRTVMQPDSATRTTQHDFGTPMFQFEALDQVIRSVPLRTGYQAIVRLYSEGDDGIEMDTVRVEGQDKAGLWNVRFADPVIIAHYGIDGVTRHIVRHDIARHADRSHMEYVFER